METIKQAKRKEDTKRLKVGGYDTVSRCAFLMCDIEYEMNKVDLNNPQDMDDGYQYMVSIIESSGFFLQNEKDEMLAILNDDSLSLIDSYRKVCEYLEKKIEASGEI